MKTISSFKKISSCFILLVALATVLVVPVLYAADQDLGATEVEIDKQGRINIPSTLIQHANLEKECVVVGVSSKIEIWSKDAWENYFSEAEESFDEIAENMIGFDF